MISNTFIVYSKLLDVRMTLFWNFIEITVFYRIKLINNSNSLNKWIIKFLFLGGADSNKGKSKKWKKILQFPHITQCIDMKDKLGMFYVSIDNTIYSIVMLWDVLL